MSAVSGIASAVSNRLNARRTWGRTAAIAGLVLSSFAVTGCATAPTNISFDGASGTELQTGFDASGADEAILIVAVGPVGTGGAYEFRPVDRENGTFLSGPIYLGFGSWGIGDKMQRPADEASSIWVLQDEINFLIKKVKPGLYAANNASWNTFNGVSSGSAWLCRKDGAASFEIKPGTINLVSSRDAFPPGIVTRLSSTHSMEDVLAQFERTRVNYPDLKGEPVLVPPTFETRWEPKPGFFSDACNSVADGSLTVTPIRLSVEDGEPDEADKAAIALALKNIENAAQAETSEEPKPAPADMEGQP
ncbi:hypothetical protein [Henriciella litoralis]|uniref:hypothetical protein n=1 Tax=Henriciella litoralis TaxID=568102 RepID=UPI00111C2827|nr:hypothetical protein [Henriciella litoralis]